MPGWAGSGRRGATPRPWALAGLQEPSGKWRLEGSRRLGALDSSGEPVPVIAWHRPAPCPSAGHLAPPCPSAGHLGPPGTALHRPLAPGAEDVTPAGSSLQRLGGSVLPADLWAWQGTGILAHPTRSLPPTRSFCSCEDQGLSSLWGSSTRPGEDAKEGATFARGLGRSPGLRWESVLYRPHQQNHQLDRPERQV